MPPHAISMSRHAPTMTRHAISMSKDDSVVHWFPLQCYRSMASLRRAHHSGGPHAAAPMQEVGEPLDWHVGDGEQGVEHDAKVLGQFVTICCLKIGLGWG